MTDEALTPEAFTAVMDNIKKRNGGDPESTHYEMDDVMCDLLCALGYGAGIEIFNSTSKWYA